MSKACCHCWIYVQDNINQLISTTEIKGQAETRGFLILCDPQNLIHQITNKTIIEYKQLIF